MADDIIDRLRCSYADPPCEQCTFCAARAEIERLRTELSDTRRLKDDLLSRLRESGCGLLPHGRHGGIERCLTNPKTSANHDYCDACGKCTVVTDVWIDRTPMTLCQPCVLDALTAEGERLGQYWEI